MKYNKQYIIGSLALLLSLGSMSCEDHNHKGEHSHGESDKHEQTDAEHEEKEVAEISLKQMQAVGIEVAPLAYKALDETIRANGHLRLPNSHKTLVSSVYGGVLKELFVHSGDKVKKGQVIAYIYAPELLQLQEEYWSAKAERKQAKLDYQRQKTLAKEGASSQKTLQTAEALDRQTKIRLASVLAKLELAGISAKSLQKGKLISRIPLYASASGVVSATHQAIGSILEANSIVAEIIDRSGLHLELNVYEQDLPKLSVGQTIHYRLTNNANKEYDAHIYSIGSSFEEDSHTIVVHCKLDKVDETFIDGMSITGLISVGAKEQSPVLPEEAIVHKDGKDFIFMQVADDDEEEEGEEVHNEGEHFHFKAVEVIRGISNLGFTAIQPVQEIDLTANFVQKGAFFIAAELQEPAGHHH